MNKIYGYESEHFRTKQSLNKLGNLSFHRILFVNKFIREFEKYHYISICPFLDSTLNTFKLDIVVQLHKYLLNDINLVNFEYYASDNNRKFFYENLNEFYEKEL